MLPRVHACIFPARAVPTQSHACHLNFSATRGARACRAQNFEVQCIYSRNQTTCSNPKTLEHGQQKARAASAFFVLHMHSTGARCSTYNRPRDGNHSPTGMRAARWLQTDCQRAVEAACTTFSIMHGQRALTKTLNPKTQT